MFKKAYRQVNRLRPGLGPQSSWRVSLWKSVSELECVGCRAAGTGIRAPLLLFSLCQYSKSEMSPTLKMLFASQMGKDGNDLVEFVGVVWPRAMHFLNQLQEHIFLFTVSGCETTTKPLCHSVIVIYR